MRRPEVRDGAWRLLELRPATGDAGCCALTRRTAIDQAATAAMIPNQIKGSNDQPRSRLAAEGGSVGTGPWASAGAGPVSIGIATG